MVSAPSGTGKTTLCRKVLEELGDITFSVSHTTRPPRTGEMEGRDYFFVDEATFKEMISKGEFIEWARVHGNYYGTSRENVLSNLECGKDVFLDIDVQGARQVREYFPKAVLIFILPPSWQELESRLRGRKSDDEATIAKRLKNARQEIAAVREYDYAVVNDDIDTAKEQLISIIVAQRLRMPRLLAQREKIPILQPA